MLSCPGSKRGTSWKRATTSSPASRFSTPMIWTRRSRTRRRGGSKMTRKILRKEAEAGTREGDRDPGQETGTEIIEEGRRNEGGRGHGQGQETEIGTGIIETEIIEETGERIPGPRMKCRWKRPTNYVLLLDLHL